MKVLTGFLGMYLAIIVGSVLIMVWGVTGLLVDVVAFAYVAHRNHWGS